MAYTGPKTKSGAPDERTSVGKEEAKRLRMEERRADIGNTLVQQRKELNKEMEKSNSFMNWYTGRTKQVALINQTITKDGKLRVAVTADEADEIETILDNYESIGDKLNNQFPILEKMFGSMSGIASEAADLVGDFGLGLGLLILLVKKAFEFAKSINKAREDFGILAKDAAKVVVSLKLAEQQAKLFMIDSEDFKNNFTQLVDKLGQANSEMAFFNVQFSRTLRNSGIQAENGAEFLSILMSQSGVSKELALTELERLATMARMEKVAPAQIFEDLANNADTFASFIGNSEKELIKAASAARKLGFEFGNIVTLGDELLNVTDRINKEQQLSLILGRQVSLQRVAALSAQGKVDAAQRELASQLRGFSGLSALQQRQAAGVVGGAGVAELRKMLGLLEDMNTGINKGNRQYMMTQSN